MGKTYQFIIVSYIGYLRYVFADHFFIENLKQVGWGVVVQLISQYNVPSLLWSGQYYIVNLLQED